MPYSIYSKIRDILQAFDGIDPIDYRVMAQQIHDDQLKESFDIWIHSIGAPIKSRCKEELIRAHIRFVADLELVTIDDKRFASLTMVGRNALTSGNFDTQLSAQLKKYMREKLTLSFLELERIIKNIKRPDIPNRPTILDAINSKPNLHVADAELRRLLYLLERCGELEAGVTKIYAVKGR